MQTISPKLLEVLVCPITLGPLKYDKAKQILISNKAGVYFEIKEGIPILIEEEAQPL